ncbi:MAG: M23 family metallopeptidase [Paludibacteraceae bacterium]|nr:M23 family metallopeptidase [Paludibacteraceae bacterium]
MKLIWKILLGILGIILIGLLIPQNLKMPVQGANSSSYNHNTFWHEGWSAGVHRGVDVFTQKGTPIHSATIGIVLATGDGKKSGKCILILGPKWRLHYYAHLDQITTSPFALVGHNTPIGTVGKTGNAANTPPHLHYSIFTPIPYPWRMDQSPHGYQKMFYLNPIDYLE